MNSSTVKNMFKDLSGKDWIIIFLVIIILLLSIGLGIYYHKYQKAEGQVVIWNDSTYIYKNKYNEEYAAKNTYILEAEQLKKYNSELYKEYKSLKDNPVVITKTVVVTKIDSIKTNTNNSEIKENNLTWNWSANDLDFYRINGRSIANFEIPDLSKTFIDNFQIDAKLSMDVIDNGQQLSVIAKSDNPYVHLGEMQSVVIDPKSSPTISNYYKPKRWGLSLYLGGGLNVGYDLLNGPQGGNKIGVNAGLSFGAAITYSVIQW